MHHQYIDKLAYGHSPIHSLDPRAKTLAVVAYTAVLISVPKYDVIALAPYAIFPFALLMFGEIPLRFFAKHTVIVSPFVLCLALFSPIWDDSMQRFGPYVVRGGWLTCASVLIKFFFGMGALISLSSTTKFPELLKGLEQLHVPRALVMQLRFLYRYLFALIEQAMVLRRARDARDAGRGPSRLRLQAVGGLIGMLFVRTLGDAEAVNRAMMARGYEGEIRILRPLRLKAADWLFMAAVCAYVIVLRWGSPLREVFGG